MATSAVTQNVNVDLNTGKSIPTAFVHQNDTSRTIIFEVTENKVPYDLSGYTIKFAYVSPKVNGQYIVIAGNQMVEGELESEKTGWVYFTPTEDYTRISGVGLLTMILTPYGQTENIRPVNIRFAVQKSADGEDAIAGASDFVPVLEEYMSENMETYISEWLDDHPEATTTVEDNSLTTAKYQDGSITEAKLSEALKLKTVNAYVTPEMFGAVGDGVTDDTAALAAMFAAVKTAAPSFEIASGHEVKDLSGTKFVFPKKYNISSPLTIYGVRGLVINNLYLCCTSFTGSAMLSFGYDVRSSRIVNCTIDAAHVADNCIEFTDYTLGVVIDSCTLLKFEKHGLYATGKGHELIVNNCKIYQYEYAEWTDQSVTKSSEGTGIYFDGLRADNHISKCIVNYCVDYGLYIATGPNLLSDCHVYSCACYFGRNSVLVTGFYFDNSQAEIMGGASVRNSCFYIYGNTYAVSLKETASDKWRYEGSWVTGNYFSNVDGVDSYSVAAVSVASGDYTVNNTELALYDNSCVLYATQNNKPSSIKRRTSADYLPKFEANKITLGNYVIQWGFSESDAAITFPSAYHYQTPIVIVNKYTGDTVVPYCNSVTLTGFWLGGTNGKKTQWVAIGRQGY